MQTESSSLNILAWMPVEEGRKWNKELRLKGINDDNKL